MPYDEVKIKFCQFSGGRGLLIYDVRDDMWKGIGLCNGWVEYLEGTTLDRIANAFEEFVLRREREV